MMLRTVLRRGKTDQRADRIVCRLAHQMGERLPEPDQLVTLTRRATGRAIDRLLPKRAAKWRAAERKHRRGRLYRTAGLAGAGLLASWMLAAKHGTRTWQTAQAQLAKVGRPLLRARQPATTTSIVGAEAEATPPRAHPGVGDGNGGDRGGIAVPSPLPSSETSSAKATSAKTSTNSNR